MTTTKAFADGLIRGNGRVPGEDPRLGLVLGEEAPDDPPAVRIVEYVNQGNRLAYGVTFPNDDPEKYLRESEYIRNPKIYWERGA